MNENHSIHASLDALKDQPAWGLTRSVGSMFFLEIGRPRPKLGRNKVHGEWHFLVEMCHWRIETKDMPIVGSDDDQEFIDNKFASLELGEIKEARLSGPTHDLHLIFSSGIRLITFSASAAEKDGWTQWLFFCPDDKAWRIDTGDVPTCGNIYAPRK